MKIRTGEKKRRIRLGAAVLSLLLLFSAEAFANSAIMRSEGVSSGGAVLETDCPLSVVHEDLTFDITGFADDFSVRENEISTGTVTAEYTLFNEGDTEIRAELAFAAGFSGGSPFADAGNPVKIRKNGEELPCRTRYTRDSGEPDVKKLSGEPREDSFFTPDMPVYVKSCTVSKNGQFTPKLSGDWDRLWIPSAGKGPDGPVLHPMENEPLLIYSFGKGEDLLLEAEELDVMTETVEVTDLFSVIAKMEERPSDISDTDWYNVVIESWNENEIPYGEGKALCGPVLRENEERLIRWYEYTLSAGPGETFVNTVTVPLFPEVFGTTSQKSVDNNYTYLLSPARSFHRFGTLDVKINSPYRPALFNRSETLEKDGDVYRVSFDTLPEGELEFGVTIKKAASQKSASPGVLGVLFSSLLSLILTVLKWALIAAALAVLIVIITKRFRRKK